MPSASIPTQAPVIPNESELLALIDALHKIEREFKLGARFNLFEALSIAKQEIRHSRFLAYLLDPRENHGLGDRFLRRLLLAASAENRYLPVTRLALSIQDLSDALVYCERDHFDIAIELPKLGLFFVIENKVDASESADQLITYRERAQQRHPEYSFMGCFLTPDGYDGEDPTWGVLSYSAIAAEIRNILTESTPPADISLTLNHYIDLIERKIVTSQALIDACREIYRAHKVALDLIIEHGQQSLLSLAFEDFKSGKNLNATTTRSETLYFLHADWLDIKSALVADRKRWSTEFPVQFWFQLTDKKLQLRLEIGPVSEVASSRENLVELFRKAYPGRGNRTSPSYTRVHTISKKLTEDPAVDDVLNAMNELWGKWEKEHGGVQRVQELINKWVAGSATNK